MTEYSLYLDFEELVRENFPNKTKIQTPGYIELARLIVEPKFTAQEAQAILSKLPSWVKVRKD